MTATGTNRTIGTPGFSMITCGWAPTLGALGELDAVGEGNGSEGCGTDVSGFAVPSPPPSSGSITANVNA